MAFEKLPQYKKAVSEVKKAARKQGRIIDRIHGVPNVAKPRKSNGRSSKVAGDQSPPPGSGGVSPQ